MRNTKREADPPRRWWRFFRWGSFIAFITLLGTLLTLVLGGFDLRDRIASQPQGLTLAQWGNAAQAVCLGDSAEHRAQRRSLEAAWYDMDEMFDNAMANADTDSSTNTVTVRWDKTAINKVAQAIEDQNDLDRARLAELRLIPGPALRVDQATVTQFLSDGEAIIAATESRPAALRGIKDIDGQQDYVEVMAVFRSVADFTMTTRNVHVPRWSKTARSIGAPACVWTTASVRGPIP